MTYHPLFADHLEHPRNVGDLPDASVIVEQHNPACGDQLRLSLRIEDGVIKQAGIKAYGCPQTLAAASAMSELIKGRNTVDALSVSRQEIADAIGGLARNKMHAAALALDALVTAIKKYNQTKIEPGTSEDR
jgi:NifU-like protein involved in Fe-S cluster formation